MRNYHAFILIAAFALAILMIAMLHLQQHQANAQTITSIQNQTDGHGQSSMCINGVCTNGTCSNDSCETSIRCVNGKCETSSSVTNKFP
jgi:uncharacterized low-complexity protein